MDQEWDKKAVEAKERYLKLVKEFEANGGDRNATVAKKRGGKGASKKAPAKKGKKRADSEDEDEDEDSD